MIARLYYRATKIPDRGALRERVNAIYALDRGVLPSPIGTAGFTLPKLSDLVEITARFGDSKISEGNWLIAADAAHGRKLAERIRIDRGCIGNIILAGKGACSPNGIHLKGNGGVVILGEDCTWFADISLRLSSDDEVFFWGKKASSNGSSIVLSGAATSVIIGDDCMFAIDTVVRTSDLHSIVSLGDGRWLNRPQSVLLQSHVWVGHGAMILKGVTVGAGSVIGAKSLVNRDVPSASIAAGLPAKVIKTGVTWDRATEPGSDVLHNALAIPNLVF